MDPLNPYRAPDMEELVDEESASGVSGEVRRVRTGLLFVHHGINAVLLAMLAGPLIAILGSFLDFWIFPTISGLLMLVGLVGGYGAYTIGQWICTAVPMQTNAKLFATLAAGSQSISVLGVLGWISGIVGFWAFDSGTGQVATIIAGYSSAVIMLAFVISGYLFVIFLKRLCLYLGEDDLAQSGNTTTMLIGVFISSYFLLYAISAFGGGQVFGDQVFGEIVGAIIALALFCLALVCFWRFTSLVNRTAKAIRRLDRLST